MALRYGLPERSWFRENNGHSSILPSLAVDARCGGADPESDKDAVTMTGGVGDRGISRFQASRWVKKNRPARLKAEQAGVEKLCFQSLRVAAPD
jgi:hypothetical protein